ncbi:hypothetical protein [Streptomyces sp. PTD5-9]|uniref:hypothetical protein n=1 Tax=Streptomyces sp. PTD5-9 TaxID=3120150 RepID=UPI003009F5CF
MVQKAESDTEPKERRIDLSLPQVAGSAVAAVAAAVAASQLGVYGTILGAGVMSVVATCGGSVFQHIFRRTGEQIREVTVQAKQQGRETDAPVRGQDRTGPPPGERWPAGPDRGAGPAVDATTLLPVADPAAAPPAQDATTVLRAVGGDQDLTRPMRPFDETRPLTAARPGTDEEFSEATTHGTRFRGWKRSAAGAAVVFAVAMAGITAYELVSGNDLNGGHGTTVGSVVRGGERDSGTNDPAPSVSTDPGRDRTPQREGGATTGADPGNERGQQGRDPGAGQGGRATTGPAPDATQQPGDTGGDRTGPSPAVTPPAPSVPGDGGAAPEAPAQGDAPAQGGQATPGTGSVR